ncbi:hypothetical protein OAO01_07935 [Oligoflexia bacterium]|nr:hypothetical protein [Oligoflexia bacterium]
MNGYAKTAAVLILLVLVPVIPAYAYIDAGTGSMILQAILGGVAGLAVLLKLYWRRILAFFKRKP